MRQSKKSSHLVLLCLFYLLSTVACATSPKPPTADKLHSIIDNPGFEHFKVHMQKFISEFYPEHKGEQTFFLSHYSKSENTSYMIWKEGRKLWIFTPGNESEWSWGGIRETTGGQFIDLDEDVVASQKDVGSSTYLVHQSWVNEKLFDAAVNGDIVIIDIK
jgi:hypothetical protein